MNVPKTLTHETKSNKIKIWQFHIIFRKFNCGRITIHFQFQNKSLFPKFWSSFIKSWNCQIDVLFEIINVLPKSWKPTPTNFLKLFLQCWQKLLSIFHSVIIHTYNKTIIGIKLLINKHNQNWNFWKSFNKWWWVWKCRCC